MVGCQGWGAPALLALKKWESGTVGLRHFRQLCAEAGAQKYNSSKRGKTAPQ